MKKFKKLILEEQEFFNMNHLFAKFVMKLLEKRIKIRIGLNDFICYGFSYKDKFSIVEYPVNKWNIYTSDGSRISSIAMKSQIDASRQLYRLLDKMQWNEKKPLLELKKIYHKIEYEF